MTLLKHLAVLTAAAAPFVAACSEGPTTPAAGDPSLLIMDAVHGSGNEHFFWLPPMVGNPGTFNGAFDGDVSPVVSICDLADCANNLIVEYTTTTGAGSETVRVVPEDEHYIVNWHTDEFGLDPALTYRIGVLVAGIEVGFLDVDVVSNGNELKNVDTGEFVALKDGRTLPIKFRIEEGAVFVVGSAGRTFSAQEGAVVLEVPPGALTTEIGITIEPSTSLPTDQSLILGTVFDFQPDGTLFSLPTTLTLTYDEANLAGLAESELTILTEQEGEWVGADGATVNDVANTVTALIDGFSRKGVGRRVTTVDVTPPAATLDPTETLQLAAIPRFGNGDPVARKVTWTSLDIGVATVDRTGLVTAVTPGTVTIEANSGSATGSAEITVEDPDAGPFSYCLTEALAACIVNPVVSIENTVFDDLADGINGNGIGSWSVQIRYTGRASFAGGVPFFLDVTAGVFLPSLIGSFNLTSTLRFLPFVDLLEADGSFDVVGPLDDLAGLFPETDVLTTEFVLIRTSSDPDLLEIDGCLTGLGGGPAFPLCVRIEGL